MSWEKVELKDEGDVVDEIQDPKAHKKIKELEDEITKLKQEVFEAGERGNKFLDEASMNRLKIAIVEEEKKDIEIKNSLMATDMNCRAMELHHTTAMLTSVEEKYQALVKATSPTEGKIREIEQELASLRKEVGIWREIGYIARTTGFTEKRFIRKLKELLSDIEGRISVATK